MDFTKTITHLGLCAGYGGIELGLKRVIPTLRSVALCEIESFAIANLVSKMEAGLLDAAPIWANLKTFPWESFRDRVDILTGGYPCQPFSAAGKRLGTDDPRHLWPFIADGIRILRPKLCFFENVEGHISLGLREVIGELESMGYKVSWGLFSASECGAPHQRKRVFILAVASGFGGASGLSGESYYSGHQAGWPSRPGEQQYGWEPPRVVNSASARQQAQRSEPNGEWGQGSTSQSGQLADSNATGRADWSEQCGRECPPSGEGISSISGCGAVPEAGELADSHRIDRSAQTEGREHDRQTGSAGEDLGNTSEQGRKGSGRQDDSRGSLLRSSESDGSCTDRSMESGQRQTQSTMGRNFNEPSGGLDYAQLCITCDNRTDSGTSSECGGELADSIDDGCNNADSRPIEHGVKGSLGEETAQQSKRDRIYCSEHGQTFGNGQLHPDLYISCDNRTDELRLLGNGVVPATAALAFRTLMNELCSLQFSLYSPSFSSPHSP